MNFLLLLVFIITGKTLMLPVFVRERTQVLSVPVVRGRIEDDVRRPLM